ncbi:2-dehydropantoate 2-reductase [Azotobacter vinelandii CA]|uniref:2-dehydropantoate 2-reductase n=2 Tax=Azotobacter vinelandii TaxID=354 RepID=C1DID5_AZOVD|nr:2-dehydropantoate 2-reductase [Azotobacter vinelandii]ACO76632.1 2-dehydropantoate 2-reductase [Azotobacter vinelandii DJ]AGK15627.1 2-dehydropantoate 2-reductase [Azotobacter vinelandii CA]AGK19250.1 2-dehydropantoate 2-reductase [Azotobacter vinelandii CA6]WKN22388.1 2-dehydropantoate 2-reductase [Azotobacter vinelandii]SFX12577.1 ketopantoate reductase [Azotobacter vinelandii]
MSTESSIAVVGGGSLGLYLAGRLSLAGHAVTVAQRPGAGAQADGIAAEGDESWQAPAVRYAPLDELRGPFAQVVVAVKSHDLGELLPRLTSLGDAASEYVFLQNGIPWWWSHRDGEIAGVPFLARSVALVVQHAVERTAPGRIRVRRTGSDRYICARVQGGPDAPLLALVEGWRVAGIPAESTADIRREVWTKLMSNATLNPLSAITGATVGELARTPRTREVLLAGMAEIYRLAERDGHPPSLTPEQRVRRAEEVGGTRTSMLQDRLAGRRLEIEALLAAPIAIAEGYGEPVPVLRTLLGCLALANDEARQPA